MRGNPIYQAVLLGFFTFLISNAESLEAQANPAKIGQVRQNLMANAAMRQMTDVSQLQRGEPVTSLSPVPEDAMGQLNNVFQLQDVQPSDWAYQALSDLIERYGCLVGYPDGTFRGRRALSRYEFAAGLNSCLQQMERLLAEATADLATREDLEILERLQQEFAEELALLSTRTDQLEARTAQLEDSQFSTTTKLFGQVVVGLQGRGENSVDFFPVDGTPDFDDPFTEINVVSNVQLSLFTQFSPRSVLLTGLQAGTGNTSPLRITNDSRLGYEGDTGGQFQISDVTYRHLIGDNLGLIAGVRGVSPVNVFRGANRVESAGSGPLSSFAQRNPIIGIGGGSGGFGFDWQISDRVNLQGVYTSSLPANASFGGLFGGDFGDTTLGVQLSYTPINELDITFNYLNAYSPFGTIRTGVGDEQLILDGNPLNTDAFGATVSWRISPKVTLGGWFGYTNSTSPVFSGSSETINWMSFLNFPDLFGEGNLGGIYVGQPPKITSSDFPTGFNLPSLVRNTGGVPGGQNATTTHVEAFYLWQVTDNISLTPGTILVFNPGHISGSDTLTIGALRMTLTF
ncbi:iron uptake porin [Spirulina sp. CS-785/01]|uniref:iron uptake porin n=1 Tax=Spirulina sp. CS-785/01 TaxID=3021716 RepID=UPI00232AA984|nr:iron uptake porin [Spirulina sp. CS-785/01]MDB9315084.1 iron uptake porin [Spirulina sp. CS-785/01]